MHLLRRPDLNSSYTTDHQSSQSHYESWLPYITQHRPGLYYMYQQVYLPAKTYPALTEVTLHNIASSADNLLCFLLIQMPNLKHVQLGPTQLTEGSWKSVIECLRQYNRFSSFQYSGEGIIIGCDSRDVEEYILHGGRHPCLLDEQPTYAAEAYMLKIDVSLRRAAGFSGRRRKGTHVVA